jgi:replicative DNA helicase
VTPVSLTLLQSLADEAGPKARTAQSSTAANGFELQAWIETHCRDVEGPDEWKGGKRWVFPVCPWNSAHTNRSAYIVQTPNGAISAGCHHNGCKGKNWQALRDQVEPGWSQRRHAGAAADNQTGDVADEWDPVVPFAQFHLPPFPSWTLPGWLRDFVEAEAVATQTSVDLAAMLSLSAVAAAIAKKVRVLVKKGYTEPVNIFTVTGLPSGNRKSPVFSAVCRPLDLYEKSEARRLAPEIARQTSAYKIKDGEMKRAEDAAIRAKPEEHERLVAAATKMAEKFSGFRIPSTPRLIVDDCTPERLPAMLQEQDGRIALMSPEGDVFDLMAGRYSVKDASNLGVYLKGHAGDQIRVDRVGRPPDFVDEPALTVGLAVQPDVIRGLAEKPGFRGRGLLARFLYALPESLLGRRDVNAPPLPDDVREAYHKNLLTLLALPFAFTEDGLPTARLLSLSPNAQEALNRFEAWVEPQLAEFGDLGGIADWGGKLVGAVARIAGILHMAAFSSSRSPWEFSITLETIEHAIEIGTYLIPHAKAAFAEMGADAVLQGAKHILRWIEDKQLTVFTRRDLHQGLKTSFKRVEELDAPLSLLGERGYVRKRPDEKPATPGRPQSPTYDVNPLWPPRRAQTPKTPAPDGNFEDCEDFEQGTPRSSRPRRPSDGQDSQATGTTGLE